MWPRTSSRKRWASPGTSRRRAYSLHRVYPDRRPVSLTAAQALTLRVSLPADGSLSEKERWPLKLVVYDLTVFAPEQASQTAMGGGSSASQGAAGFKLYFTFYGPPIFPAGLGPAVIALMVAGGLLACTCSVNIYLKSCAADNGSSGSEYGGYGR